MSERKGSRLFVGLTVLYAVFAVARASRSTTTQAELISVLLLGVCLQIFAFMMLSPKGTFSNDRPDLRESTYSAMGAASIAAIALALLLGIVVWPWFGAGSFELWLGRDHWWVVPVLAVVLFPWIRERLQ
jgi:hypothetical protein